MQQQWLAVWAAECINPKKSKADGLKPSAFCLFDFIFKKYYN
jgi:hypothetical protein